MKNKLLKFFNTVNSHNGEYLNELRNDHEFFKREIINNFDRMTKRLYKHYKYFSLDYVKKIIGHFKDGDLISNPLSMRYIESEFSILNNQIDLIERLKKNGFNLKNRTVLEIGCANGCLLFACSQSGAKKLVGIDINQSRLKNAREFLGKKLLKKKVELLLIDIFSQELPYAKSSFDVIFSTNVLEHVHSTCDYFGKIKEYLSDKTEGSFALTSVCNKYNISSILAEPHYGIPGLILLDRKEASNIWQLERKKLYSNLDYEVFDWFLYEEYQNIAFSQGLETFPLLDNYNVDLIDSCLINCKDFADKYYNMAIEKLTNLSLIKSNNDMLAGAIKKYFDEYIKDHTAEEVTLQRKVYLYLKYHAYVLEMITMHKGSLARNIQYGLFVGNRPREVIDE